jgi:hypothetical protein
LEGHACYVDITGEPEFIERMEVKYHEEAKAKVCCGVIVCYPQALESPQSSYLCADPLSMPNDDRVSLL